MINGGAVVTVTSGMWSVTSHPLTPESTDTLDVMTTCAVDDCERSRYAKGYCKGHYDRLKRTGSAGTTPIQSRRTDCQVSECDNPHLAHGYCRLHYKRWAAHGDPSIRLPGKPYTGRTEEQVRQRIETSVRITPSGCWEWKRSVTVDGGYATLRWRGITPGHRVAYTIFVGPIPEGMFVCHHCDNPPCVNPDHLFLGTAADNNADMTNKGRARRAFKEHPRGEQHPSALLTQQQADEIRTSSERGVDLARRYGVSQQTVCDIRAGRRWRSLTPPSDQDAPAAKPPSA